MGYTHYYRVSAEFDADKFFNVASDFKKMITPLKHLGISLGDGHGENHPIITPKEICFNGLKNCGHQKRHIVLPWPGENATGVATHGTDTKLVIGKNTSWFAGPQIETRVCNGDCSYETFSLQQKFEKMYDEQSPEASGGLFFDFCKTAYRPYDLAVNTCLVIAQHHLGPAIEISSDGDMNHWEESMQLCNHFLGFGADFTLGGS